MEKKKPKPFLTVPEFAEEIGFSVRTVNRPIAMRTVRSFKLLRSRRIPRSEIEDLPKRLLAEQDTGDKE